MRDLIIEYGHSKIYSRRSRWVYRTELAGGYRQVCQVMIGLQYTCVFIQPCCFVLVPVQQHDGTAVAGAVNVVWVLVPVLVSVLVPVLVSALVLQLSVGSVREPALVERPVEAATQSLGRGCSR